MPEGMAVNPVSLVAPLLGLLKSSVDLNFAPATK